MLKGREQNASDLVPAPSHRPPLQRRLSRTAKGLRTRCYSQLQRTRCVMDDPYDDLILAMFALAVTAVMLVAGELYLVTRPEAPEIFKPPASIVTSSMR
jgi:hypothetical protein